MAEEHIPSSTDPPDDPRETYRPRKIVSGGQTGVDRGALDAAICLNIPHGGWCPQGRLAENGLIPHHYRLRETDEREYTVRTERNVIDSDATLIIFRGILSGGTRLTYQKTTAHHKPAFLLDLESLSSWNDERVDEELSRPEEASDLLEWLNKGDFEILNVAGPRESGQPGIEAETARLLIRLFSRQ